MADFSDGMDLSFLGSFAKAVGTYNAGNARKRALQAEAQIAEYQAQIGNPPPAENWAAYIFNIVHDELDAECAEAYRLDVARCIHESMQRGMRLAGIVDLPTCAPDDTPEKLIVKSWADK